MAQTTSTPLPQVDAKQLHEDTLHNFSGFASDLGFPPGYFPPQITTMLGNGQPFNLTRLNRDSEGDVMSAVYDQQLGIARIHVIND